MVVSQAPTDPRVAQIAKLFDHLAWADAELARALASPGVSPDAVREYAHVAGAEELWLSRIERRPPTAAGWPEFNASEAAALAKTTGDGFKKMIAALDDATVDAPVTYTNSAGKTFTSSLGDILVHVALHGQYHRGKVNLMLRQAGMEPAPVDFIGFVRGVPAATQKTSR